jgi:cytidylate kinase
MHKRVVVAIDGPAGAGKSTVARSLARKLGFVYLNTGAMYRAVALWALRRDIEPGDMHRLAQLAAEAEIVFTGDERVLLNGEDVTDALAAPEVAEAASKVSAIPSVRRALVEKQRRIGSEISVVAEGRDVGTVVFPDAQIKIFLDADKSARANRRVNEFRGSEVQVDVESVARQLDDRDHRDRTRAEAPLVQSPDAVYLDSTALNADEVEELILKLVRDRTANGKEYSR